MKTFSAVHRPTGFLELFLLPASSFTGMFFFLCYAMDILEHIRRQINVAIFFLFFFFMQVRLKPRKSVVISSNISAIDNDLRLSNLSPTSFIYIFAVFVELFSLLASHIAVIFSLAIALIRDAN